METSSQSEAQVATWTCSLVFEVHVPVCVCARVRGPGLRVYRLVGLGPLTCGI